MRVTLRYGEGRLPFDLPRARLAGHHAARAATGADTGVLARGLAELDACSLRREIRKKICALLLPDGTRPEPAPDVLLALLERMSEARALRVFLCTGTHDPELASTRERALRLVTALRGGPGFEIVVHDARRAAFTSHGRTERGTPVEVATALDECDALLTYSEVKHHYFAGYSNPGKCTLPGLASLETVRANHSLALEAASTFGRHPWHPRTERRANPLAEDLVQGYELAVAGRPSFALALVPGDAHGSAPRAACGGETRDAAGRAMLAADEAGGLCLAPTRYLVVSAGGAPYDESLYTAQRALELSREAVLPGGEILFLARCPNGVGSEAARREFYEPLTRPLEEIVAPPREEYRLYGHKPVAFARLLRRVARLHLVSDLPEEEVRAMHLEPARDAQAVLGRWLREGGEGDRVRFLDDGSRLAVVGEGG